MRKKCAAALLCALLIVQLAIPAHAAGDVYFVAAEASVLPLTDATMPFWSGGNLYVAASAFSGLGASVINNTAKKMTVLEMNRRALLFDWEKGTVQDGGGNLYSPGAILSGGVVFVPASMTSVFFGLQYSVTEVSNGFLVWLRSPDFGMTARDFANAATYSMEERYAAYRKDAQSGTQSSTPSAPSAATAGARIHLCLMGDARTGSLLDALDRAEGWATFYCTPDYLEENSTLLRRMTASGHTVGILLDGTSAEPVEAQLQRGNDALYRATLGRTRLVYLPGAETAALEALTQAGCSCLTPTLDRTAYQLESSSNAASLLKRVTSRRGDVSVWLGDTASAAGLRAFVTSAQSAGHSCGAMTEMG